MEVGSRQSILLHIWTSHCDRGRDVECECKFVDCLGLGLSSLIIVSGCQDLEDDIVFGTMNVIPRMMHRVLYVLTGDRRLKYAYFLPPVVSLDDGAPVPRIGRRV